ncbi:hypothetical protein SLE2022_301800 [Rubroshorea leprosula]
MSQRKGTDGTIQCTRVYIHISLMPFDRPRNPLQYNQDHTYACNIIRNTTRAFQNLGNICFHEFHGPQIKIASFESTTQQSSTVGSPTGRCRCTSPCTTTLSFRHVHIKLSPKGPPWTPPKGKPSVYLPCLVAMIRRCDVIDGDADTLVVPCVG